MKKNVLLGLKITGVFLGLILVLAIAIPFLFKDKIRAGVEKAIDESVNAQISFGDYRLGLFRHFPDLTFTIMDLTVAGEGDFIGDTLTVVEKFGIVFNLSSLFGKGGYEVESVIIENAAINALVARDGRANWDIMADTSSAEEPAEGSQSDMKIILKSVEIKGSTIRYTDLESDMIALLSDVNMSLQGDMTASQADLEIILTAGQLTYEMEGFRYLNNVKLETDLDVLADLENYKYTFRNSFFRLNDLRVDFLGTVEMPSDDIRTDIEFSTGNSSFKSLLSLIPAVYMNDYSELEASGEFSLKGSARGVYSDADSLMPDVNLTADVRNGLISYPSLPEKISNIGIHAEIFYAGDDDDKSAISVDPFHLELAGNSFDMTFSLKNPVSDPEFRGSMIGKLDLTALSAALPMDSIQLSGLLEMSVRLAGRMSAIEKGKYEEVEASGLLNISKMEVKMAGYPEFAVDRSELEFTPAFAILKEADIRIGAGSDFSLDGRLSNYIPWFLSDATIKGNLNLRSDRIDANEIMSGMATDTSEVSDTAGLSIVRIPGNIDFVFKADVQKFSYDLIDASQVKGELRVKDGILSISDAGMDMLGGRVKMNADYDTRDSLKPYTRASVEVTDLGIKEAFNSFNTVKMLAPAAKGIDGKVNATMTYESLLGNDFMPVVSTISGSGKLMSDQVTLLESQTFDMLKQALKLGDKYTNVFRDVNVSFRISEGRIIVSPFDVRTGNLKMNISGDHGIDQTLNYFVKTEIPRSDLGSSVNALIDNLSAQAGALGIAIKPGETMKVNLKVSGTFSKPLVMPVFGNSSGTSGIKPETLDQMMQQALDSGIETGRDKAREEAEKQAAQLVKEAEEKGQMLRDEAAKAAEAIRKEAETQGKKLIENAASRSSLEKLGAQKGADALKKEADKRAGQLILEADRQAVKLVEEARTKGADLVNKI